MYFSPFGINERGEFNSRHRRFYNQKVSIVTSTSFYFIYTISTSYLVINSFIVIILVIPFKVYIQCECFNQIYSRYFNLVFSYTLKKVKWAETLIIRLQRMKEARCRVFSLSIRRLSIYAFKCGVHSKILLTSDIIVGKPFSFLLSATKPNQT